MKDKDTKLLSEAYSKIFERANQTRSENTPTKKIQQLKESEIAGVATFFQQRHNPENGLSKMPFLDAIQAYIVERGLSGKDETKFLRNIVRLTKLSPEIKSILKDRINSNLTQQLESHQSTQSDIIDEEVTLLQEDLGRILGNLYVDLFRYFKCKQGAQTAGPCPQSRDLVAKLIGWAQVNKQHEVAQKISNVINVGRIQKASEDDIITTIWNKLRQYSSQ